MWKAACMCWRWTSMWIIMQLKNLINTFIGKWRQASRTVSKTKITRISSISRIFMRLAALMQVFIQLTLLTYACVLAFPNFSPFYFSFLSRFMRTFIPRYLTHALDLCRSFLIGLLKHFEQLMHSLWHVCSINFVRIGQCEGTLLWIVREYFLLRVSTNYEITLWMIHLQLT